MVLSGEEGPAATAEYLEIRNSTAWEQTKELGKRRRGGR
jgi:hypothetical protein